MSEETETQEDLEREKLALEIKALKRSPFATPGTWISIVLAITTVGGLIGSDMVAEHKIALAELNARQKTIDAEARTAAADKAVEEADRVVSIAKTETLTLRHEALSLAKQKEAYVTQVAAAQEKLVALQETADELRRRGQDVALVNALDEQISSTSSLFNFCTPEDVEIYDRALELTEVEVATARTFNMPWGAPVGSVFDDEIAVNQAWWIGGLDPSLRVARWTAHRLDGDRLSTQRRRQDCWRPDPRLEPDSTGSSADFRGRDFDRGHLVPRADATVSDVAQASVYVYSNLSAQNPTLNRRVWSRLEQQVRRWAQDNPTPLYVVTGVIFDADADSQPDSEQLIRRVGDNQVAVPTHYYKIVLRASENQQPQAIAFLMPNDESSEEFLDSLESAVTSVSNIEQLTGLDFFPEAPYFWGNFEGTADPDYWFN